MFAMKCQLKTTFKKQVPIFGIHGKFPYVAMNFFYIGIKRAPPAHFV